MVQTEETGQRFRVYYGEAVENKMLILPYGIEVLELIDNSKYISENSIKIKFNIPTDRIVVTCGHNANKAHQHMKIINALEQLPENIKIRIVCVFPMTYPKENDDCTRNIRKKLAKGGLSYVILKEFMSFKEMAEYALISDLVICVQTTDRLSPVMLEEIYAETIVIAEK